MLESKQTACAGNSLFKLLTLMTTAHAVCVLGKKSQVKKFATFTRKIKKISISILRPPQELCAIKKKQNEIEI